MKIRHALGVAALAVSGLAHSAAIDWNQWSSNTATTFDGTITTGSGPVGVSFSGDTSGGFYTAYPSWLPAATWADGSVVANGPSGGIVRLLGGNATVDTITFSAPVTNPVFSIWSLGQGGVTASFDFIGATPVLVAGGSNAEYGGSSISVSGNVVSGNEGNGTVEFLGTYSSISWTNPDFENWYGFNVGIAGVAGTVPEPASIGLMLAALTLIGLTRRQQSR